MRKLKTSKSAQKRFKISGSGKISHRRANMNHFNAMDTGVTRRNKRKQSELSSANLKDIRNLMPY